MPFTVSHIAAVIPGHRILSRAHLFTAAVIGSMVPDFGLLIPHDMLRWQTHSFSALFTFCLPVGLLAYWLTQLVIKPAMVEVLPNRASWRLQANRVSVTDLRHWVSAGMALLLGAMTHIIWDNFTHENSRGVWMFPVLSEYGPGMAGHRLHLFRWLQYGSSVLGLAVVLGALVVWLRHAPPTGDASMRRIGPIERAIWMSVYLLLTMVGAAVAVWQEWPSPTAAFGADGMVELSAVECMRSMLACLLLVSLLIRTRLAA